MANGFGGGRIEGKPVPLMTDTPSHAISASGSVGLIASGPCPIHLAGSGFGCSHHWDSRLRRARRRYSELLDIERRVAHGFATNNGVRIHYAALGQGPLIVMIHGFPDCWLTGRQVMEALAKDYEVVAIDQRGYNLSDKPKGVEHYDISALVEDVAAVVRGRGRERAIIAGHDWGGAVAWSFAIKRPEMTEKLIILNLPHPRGIGRELARNPQQQKASAYARRFQQEGAHTNLTTEGLAFWVTEGKVKARYVEAFQRSDFEAMLNYYKRN